MKKNHVLTEQEMLLHEILEAKFELERIRTLFDYADAGIPAPLFLDGSILFLASLLMLVFTRLAYSWRRGRSLVCLILTAFWIYGIGTLVGVPVYYLSVG